VEISDEQAVRAALGHPALVVPSVPHVDWPVGIAWLRAHVGRFSRGAEHDRRRALGVAELSRLEPGELRRDARERAAAALGEGRSLRDVPVDTLTAALGLPGGLAGDVADAARAYQPHVAADSEASDRAVGRLVEACGGVADEATAARIGLLAQACDATAGLIDRAIAAAPQHPGAAAEDILAATLRDDPPVRATRRVAVEPVRIGSADVATGTVLELDLTAGHDEHLPFGSGLRPCPGREHALAIAAGVLAAWCSGDGR
jgi:hypothetical protein